MINTIIKTILIVTLGCALITSSFAFMKDGSIGTFFYIMTLAPFTIFIGPITILVLIYTFIFKTIPNRSSKLRRILSFIISATLAIIIWYFVEILDWQNDISLWTTDLIKERISKSEMGFGVVIFVPLCFITSILFDRFEYKRQEKLKNVHNSEKSNTI